MVMRRVRVDSTWSARNVARPCRRSFGLAKARAKAVSRKTSGGIILDCGGLDYISSAGLRVLLKATKELKKTSGRMCLCCIRDYIQEVLDLSGFSSFLPIRPDLNESLKGFAGNP